MKTAVHNIAPKTSAERVAAFEEQIDRLAAAVRNALNVKSEPTASQAKGFGLSRFSAPAGGLRGQYRLPADGEADKSTIANQGLAGKLGYRLPEGD